MKYKAAGKFMASRQAKENLAGFAFIGFNLVWVLVFTVYPMISSVGISFLDWNPLGSSEFVGIDNFINIFKDHYFMKALSNNVFYALTTITGGLVFAIFTALVVNNIPGKKLFRTLFFLPTVCSAIAIGTIWMWMFEPKSGLLNMLLSIVGIEGPKWLLTANWAPISLAVVVVWANSGFWMVIFLAALTDIPDSYYEAAVIDGATSWQYFWKVTLPLLTPTIFFYLTLALMTCWQQFDLSSNFAKLGGMAQSTGPEDSLILPMQHIYQNAFTSLRIGYASAMSWVIALIAIGTSAINFVLAKRWVVYDR